jgi:hypothetical protein
MATDLHLYGPFVIPISKGGVAKFIDKNEKKQFLDQLLDQGIASKQGCYVFALRAAKGYCPWYIGKATKSFKQECMGSHQLQHYNAVLSKGKKGTPVMFLVAPTGNKNKVPKKVCDDIESMLIQSALYENPELRNIQKAKVPAWGIDGVVRGRKGKPRKGESAFGLMMGL